MSPKTPMNLRVWHSLATLLVAFTLFSAPARAQQQNFMGNSAPSQIQTDPTKPVSRGYIIPSATPITGGARIAVDIYHSTLNGQVSLWLQAAVAKDQPAPVLPPGATPWPGNPNYYNLNGQAIAINKPAEMQVFSLAQLSDKVSDNPTEFHSRREFDVNYDQLNKELKSIAPNATNLEVGPGTPLFVYAKWAPTGAGTWEHQWGGVERGGIVFMPSDPSYVATAPVRSSTKRPTELDLAFPINGALTARFNDPATGAGLKNGGQVRSRVETEGKYQIEEKKAAEVKKLLFELANDPAKAKLVLGNEWGITAEMRYMKKDAAGALILDSNNLPIPDPMVDTYYDNDLHDAAKNDMAIRYRWTAGNQSGAWNFKPGLTDASKEGLVTRTEYGLDTTDDKPGTIAKFADSDNPLNFFSMIRKVIPGATPSEFLKPSVVITDTRYKFLLRHTNGLLIEVSLDDVEAESVRIQGHTAHYVQMEADVEHLATQSMNSATNYVSTLMHADPKNVAPWLAALDGTAYLAGQPLMHDQDDVLPNSPVRMKHAQDFQLATDVTVALRDHVIGKDWMNAPQKYALGAVAVGDIARNEASASVKRLNSVMAAREHAAAAAAAQAAGQPVPPQHSVNGSALCGSCFGN